MRCLECNIVNVAAGFITGLDCSAHQCSVIRDPCSADVSFVFVSSFTYCEQLSSRYDAHDAHDDTDTDTQLFVILFRLADLGNGMTLDM